MRVFVAIFMVCGCTEYGVKPGLPFVAGGDDSGVTQDESDSNPPAEDTQAPEDEPVSDDDVPFRPSDFSLGWHLLDEGERIPTNTSGAHTVSEHGDVDSYWYEPSGNHGLIGLEDPASGFERRRD